VDLISCVFRFVFCGLRGTIRCNATGWRNRSDSISICRTIRPNVGESRYSCTVCEQSTSEALFTRVTNAAFIRTDHGVVEIVVFPGNTDAEQLSITYTKDGPSRHRYRIEGPILTAPTPDIYAAAPQYFTLYKNWFIQTLDPDLEASIKRIFGQTNRPPR
jgi:hypothetical protein